MTTGTSMPQLHRKTYFRLEHYLPVSVLDKVNQTTIKEELPKLHSNYYGASDTEAEFEFLRVSETRVYSNHGFRQRDQNMFLLRQTPVTTFNTFTTLPISVLFIFEDFTLSVLNVLKVCQRLVEYGVHFHRVLPEKRSQTGIMLGVYSKGVLIFEVLNGNRTPVLRFPWRETKKISFTVCSRVCIIRNKYGELSYSLQLNPGGPHFNINV